jgi:hypothetical protein
MLIMIHHINYHELMALNYLSSLLYNFGVNLDIYFLMNLLLEPIYRYLASILIYLLIYYNPHFL